MADAGVFHLDEDLGRAGLGDGDLLVHGRSALLFDYLGELHFWDGHFGGVVRVIEVCSGWVEGMTDGWSRVEEVDGRVEGV